MSDPSTTPSVVNEQIVAEHFRVHDLTRQLESTGELGELVTCLAEFRSVLVPHFLREEALGGLYDTIRSMAPRQLVGQADELEKEHQAVLADIDALAAHAQACLTGPIADVLGKARALARQLYNHEAAEDELLTRIARRRELKTPSGVRANERPTRRGAKPPKAKVEAQRSAARKSLKNEGSRGR